MYLYFNHLLIGGRSPVGTGQAGIDGDRPMLAVVRIQPIIREIGELG